MATAKHTLKKRDQRIHQKPDFKMKYPGREAYHFPAGLSHGFPFLHPDYVPFIPIPVNVEIDMEHEYKPELEGEYLK